MRVFLDANILFSAAPPKSRLRALLEIVNSHGECITNAYAVEICWPSVMWKTTSTLP